MFRYYDDYELILEEIFKNLQKYLNNDYLNSLLSSVNYHLCQSHYSYEFLTSRLGVPKEKSYYLSDYINTDFLNSEVDFDSKENVVVYNPKKGAKFTSEIIKQGSSIKFIPLINMTKQEVIETLKKAKVYIDFGNHPGKDRIPREAAILGCCVITGKRGSAAYNEDLPIPADYKFEDKVENIPLILSKIRDCIDNFQDRLKDFENYRMIIRKEQDKFIEDLKSVFAVV